MDIYDGTDWTEIDMTRAEHGGPMIFAQMGMQQAIHRQHKRVFNPDRKDHHWGKRKLKRDQRP